MGFWFKVMGSIGFMATFVACRPQSESTLAATAPSYRIEYQVIKTLTNGFEAELKVSPSLDKAWRLEFDYPYQIFDITGAKFKRVERRYVISEFVALPGATAGATVFKLKASGRDAGVTPPSNAYIAMTVGVEKVTPGSKPSSSTSPQAGTGQPSNRPLGNGQCITEDYGLGSKNVAGPKASYSSTGSLEGLPELSVSASNADLKAFVAKVYDQFGTFKQIYETDLGLTREQALSFMYGDMSRESATNHPSTGKLVWYIELETAMTPERNSAHAWGPFQAAVTNFTGGGFDNDILNKTGLPTPTISDFKNPAISTFAGMKRLAEGIVAAGEHFGPNKSASMYLLGTLAHHNTGWVNAAEQKEWRDGYGNEVLRLAQAYRVGSNMSNDVIFYTGQAEADICR